MPDTAFEHEPGALPGGDGKRPQRPIRDLVLDVLGDLHVLIYSQQVAGVLRALYERPVPSTRFGTLSRDEESAYQKNESKRVVWLCHGLTFDRGESIRRLWGRSDWPLAERIVAPRTGRVLFLKQTIAICKLALEDAATHRGEDREPFLKYLAADLARDLTPRPKVVHGEFELTDWIEIAQNQLAKDEPNDAAEREEAAMKLQAKNPGKALLFGAPISPLLPLVRGHQG